MNCPVSTVRLPKVQYIKIFPLQHNPCSHMQSPCPVTYATRAVHPPLREQAHVVTLTPAAFLDLPDTAVTASRVSGMMDYGKTTRCKYGNYLCLIIRVSEYQKSWLDSAYLPYSVNCLKHWQTRGNVLSEPHAQQRTAVTASTAPTIGRCSLQQMTANL